MLAGIGGFLSLLLTIAEYFLANYGECKIDINDGKKIITIKGGGSLLSSLAAYDVFIPSACGGRGTCGLCKVKALKGVGPILPTEKPFLNEKERQEGIRLSCQIKVKEDISISISPQLFAIKKYGGTVTKIIDYTYDTKGVVIKLNEPKEIDFKAGQYVQLESKKYGKVKQAVFRAYSLASSPSQKGTIELIIRLVPDGIVTTFVHKYLKEGDNLNFTGPFGDFYIRDTDADMIFVAGGSGMAPFKSILEDLKNKNTERKVVFFFGARTEKDLFLTDEMKEYEKTIKNFTYIPVLSHAENSDWTGIKGFIPPLIKDYVDDAKNTEGYLCGSPGLIAATEKAMKSSGINKIYYDSFG